MLFKYIQRHRSDLGWGYGWARFHTRDHPVCCRARDCQGAAWRRWRVRSTAERRPTLTVSALCSVGNLWSGRKKACGGGRTKESASKKKLESQPLTPKFPM